MKKKERESDERVVKSVTELWRRPRTITIVTTDFVGSVVAVSDKPMGETCVCVCVCVCVSGCAVLYTH